MGSSIGAINNPHELSVKTQKTTQIAKSSVDSPNLAKLAAIEVTISIETKMLSLGRAIQNTSDAITLLQKADGYLAESEEILKRIHILSASASPALPEEQREFMQIELSELVDEVDRLSSQASFNRLPLLDGNFSRIRPKASMWFQTGPNVIDRERIYFATMSAAALSLRSSLSRRTISIDSQEEASSALQAAEFGLGKIRAQRLEIAGLSSRYGNQINDLKMNLSRASDSFNSDTNNTAIEAAIKKIKNDLRLRNKSNAAN